MTEGVPPDYVSTPRDTPCRGRGVVFERSGGPTWRFLCLVQVANFAVLRRTLGRSRAEQLGSDVIKRVGDAFGGARLAPIDHRTIEIAFEGGERDELNRTVDAISALLAQPFAIDGDEHVIDTVIGIAASLASTVDELRLLEEAEASLMEARHDRRLPTGEIAASGASGRPGLARELPGAIAGEQMRLHYQPKVHLRRQEVASVEALIRWQHPEHGLVPPNDFISVAEDARLIDRLTLWTIRRVIADQLTLRRRGYDPTIFINVSGQLLSDARFVAEVGALVQGGSVNIGFEVTETSVIRDPQSAIANLKTFAEAGIVIAIDDYGAGLSSLAYLKQLPASELKIDKLFVTHLASSNRDPLIVRSTIDLAHALEMEVVAEGVETAAALALLTVMGCDMAQGYLISRPIALDALIQFLDEERYREVAHNDRLPIGQLAGGMSRVVN